ncbi:hypothetical protein ACFL1A_01960 [Patescibacteria group bacterium]
MIGITGAPDKWKFWKKEKTMSKTIQIVSIFALILILAVSSFSSAFALNDTPFDANKCPISLDFGSRMLLPAASQVAGHCEYAYIPYSSDVARIDYACYPTNLNGLPSEQRIVFQMAARRNNIIVHRLVSMTYGTFVGTYKRYGTHFYGAVIHQAWKCDRTTDATAYAAYLAEQTYSRDTGLWVIGPDGQLLRSRI